MLSVFILCGHLASFVAVFTIKRRFIISELLTRPAHISRNRLSLVSWNVTWRYLSIILIFLKQWVDILEELLAFNVTHNL